uniref:G-protein coupled receptors family 1 profile domain-containing protein n=1 Tax=Ditylenchus dipsaci TaxID=166011 RepID=A0A915ELS3_9BILA
MDSLPVQYVTIGETIADIALREKVSASITATSSILLAVLVILCFVFNIMLVATILSSYKLRNTILYLMFCLQALLNLADVILVMFFSLLYTSNGRWCFGETFCKVNAWTQNFILLKHC